MLSGVSILEGVELIETKCIDCHKVLALKIIRIGQLEIDKPE
jgi:hypothetical protein